MDSSISQPNPLNNHHHKATTDAATTSTTTNNNNDDYQVALTNMIGRDLNFMKETMTQIQKFVDRMNVQINRACEEFEELKTRGGSDTYVLDQLKMSVKKLKSQIPSKLKIHYDDDSKPWYDDDSKPWFDDGSIICSSGNFQGDVNKAGNFLSVYNQPKFDHTIALKDIEVSLRSLPREWLLHLNVCSKIFSIFREMGTIKKRIMIYWWIGVGNREDFVLGKTAEDFVNEMLDELTAKGFIEPIYKNCGLVVDSYRMPPDIRFAVTKFCGPLAEVRSVDFERYDKSLFAYTRSPGNRFIDNVYEEIIGGRYELIFRRGTNLKVAYLGWRQNSGWRQHSLSHHIDGLDIKILNGLKNMKQLRFLSLRGISLITELPQCISQLTNLEIMDLKACHNLEVVPDWIGLLKSLTHLDISECYYLDHMPKGLGSLSELQVLKGFIIGDSKDKSSCTIDDLTKLSKLRKLSIYASMKEFPTNKQLCHLQRLNTLQKLKISWSGCILQHEIDDIPKQARPQPQLRAKLTKALTRSFTKQHDSELPLQLELPSSLQKLELECFPEKITPSWLWSSKLKNLKKLYIRGGLLCYLGAIAATTVEMLQLKYLPQLEMHWLELRTLFPNLIYLEKVECPGLTFFPCDKNGVWMNRENMQNQEMGY